MGMTPEEVFNRRRMRAVNSSEHQGAAQDYAQALASHPPKGWKHSLDGADAARMWEGAEGAKAVFWTDLKGKLAQDAPEISEYSHSIDQSEINHIRNRHGDATVERSRNQLPVSAQDVAQIPEIVTNYDAVRTDLRGHHGEQMVAYAKRVDDGVLLYMESATKKRRNLGAVSMWKYPPTVDVKQILAEAISPDHYARSVVAAYDNDNTNGQKLNQSAFDGPEVATTPLAQGVTEIEVDGAVRPALNSNGKPIHWSEDGVRNFWRWFGDSRVVDAQGRPLVVYHGTAADIEKFSYEFVGNGNDQYGSGFYFTTSPNTASGYAANEGGNVLPVYLAINNPLSSDQSKKLTKSQIKAIISSAPELDDVLWNFGDWGSEGKDKVLNKAISQLYEYQRETLLTSLHPIANDFFAGNEQAFSEAVTRVLKHDGVEVRQESGEVFFIAFTPTQIKSATGNNGQFNPQDANILHQDARGAFSLDSNTIAFLQNADESTFIHEAGHY